MDINFDALRKNISSQYNTIVDLLVVQESRELLKEEMDNLRKSLILLNSIFDENLTDCNVISENLKTLTLNSKRENT